MELPCAVIGYRTLAQGQAQTGDLLRLTWRPETPKCSFLLPWLVVSTASSS
jgi:hypothetical protein